MICIIEGPDCSGKSATAALLARAAQEEGSTAPVLIVHTGPPDPPGRDPLEEYELGFTGIVSGQAPHRVVFDRWALGEAVYGPLLRGASRLSPGGLLHCEMAALAHGAVKWVMMPPLHVIIRRMQAQGGDGVGSHLFDTEDMTAIRRGYSYLAPRYGYAQFYNIPDLATLQQAVKAMDAREERAAEIAAVLPGYAGCLSPSAVFAGDVRSTVLDPDPYLHAFTPATAHGSARYLMDALAVASRSVIRRAGICNTGEEGADLAAADQVLGSPRWVALGAAAWQRLHDAGIEPVQVNHPSYQMRFKSGTVPQSDYTDILLKAGRLSL